MTKFKPQFLLDEQMYFSDAKTSLAFQIREEAKETNRLLRKLVEQNQPAADENPDKTPEQDANDDADQKPVEPPEAPVVPLEKEDKKKK